MKTSTKHGQSMLEFMTLVALIIFAFITLKPFIQRGISGRWKTAGDALGSGRLYSPDRTLDCRFDAEFGTERWYNFDCFDQSCDCYSKDSMTANATELESYQDACRVCINTCADNTPRCADQ